MSELPRQIGQSLAVKNPLRSCPDRQPPWLNYRVFNADVHTSEKVDRVQTGHIPDTPPWAQKIETRNSLSGVILDGSVDPVRDSDTLHRCPYWCSRGRLAACAPASSGGAPGEQTCAWIGSTRDGCATERVGYR